MIADEVVNKVQVQPGAIRADRVVTALPVMFFHRFAFRLTTILLTTRKALARTALHPSYYFVPPKSNKCLPGFHAPSRGNYAISKVRTPAVLSIFLYHFRSRPN